MSRTLQFTARRTIQATATPTTVSFGTPAAADYNNGYSQSSQVITVNANAPWSLTIRSTQATWSNSGAGSRNNKPRSELLWCLTSGGMYTAMTGSAVSLASGNATAATAITVFYHVAWTWTLDTPGTYTLPITLVLTAP